MSQVTQVKSPITSAEWLDQHGLTKHARTLKGVLPDAKHRVDPNVDLYVLPETREMTELGKKLEGIVQLVMAAQEGRSVASRSVDEDSKGEIVHGGRSGDERAKTEEKVGMVAGESKQSAKEDGSEVVWCFNADWEKDDMMSAQLAEVMMPDAWKIFTAGSQKELSNTMSRARNKISQTLKTDGVEQDDGSVRWDDHKTVLVPGAPLRNRTEEDKRRTATAAQAIECAVGGRKFLWADQTSGNLFTHLPESMHKQCQTRFTTCSTIAYPNRKPNRGANSNFDREADEKAWAIGKKYGFPTIEPHGLAMGIRQASQGDIGKLEGALCEGVADPDNWHDVRFAMQRSSIWAARRWAQVHGHNPGTVITKLREVLGKKNTVPARETSSLTPSSLDITKWTARNLSSWAKDTTWDALASISKPFRTLLGWDAEESFDPQWHAKVFREKSYKARDLVDSMARGKSLAATLRCPNSGSMGDIIMSVFYTKRMEELILRPFKRVFEASKSSEDADQANEASWMTQFSTGVPNWLSGQFQRLVPKSLRSENSKRTGDDAVEAKDSVSKREIERLEFTTDPSDRMMVMMRDPQTDFGEWLPDGFADSLRPAKPTVMSRKDREEVTTWLDAMEILTRESLNVVRAETVQRLEGESETEYGSRLEEQKKKVSEFEDCWEAASFGPMRGFLYRQATLAKILEEGDSSETTPVSS